MKVTFSAIVALLFIGAVSSTALEARAAEPFAPFVALVARTKGLPPLVARQDEPSSTDTTSTPTGPTPSLPLPKVPDASPSAAIDTLLPTTSPAPSGSVSAYSPTGTGSLIPAWSSLVAGASGTLPSGGQPTAPPPYPATGTAASTPEATSIGAAPRMENGLFGGAIIAGIISLFL